MPHGDRSDGAGEPVVAYANGLDAAAAVRGADGWTTTTVERGGAGLGVSAAVSGDGTITVSYGRGLRSTRPRATVRAAAGRDGGDPRDAAAGPSATSTAVDGSGTNTVAWSVPAGSVAAGTVDAATLSDGNTYTPIDLGRNDGALDPAVATTPDGSSRYVAWYDSGPQDLILGVDGDVGGLAIGVPSPTPTEVALPRARRRSSATPVVDGKVTVVAQGIAFTDGSCIQAPAGEAFTIGFDNRDAGTQHNVQRPRRGPR